MKELVEVIAKALVDCPDEVSVSEKQEGRTTVLELHVAESDMGKVIGKQGRIAKAFAITSTNSFMTLAPPWRQNNYFSIPAALKIFPTTSVG